MARVRKIHGIGETLARQLERTGIRSTEELLKQGATPQGRRELAARSGVSETVILRWVNQAALYRLTGMGKQFANLLELTGVTSVADLAQCRVENLYRQLTQANLENRIMRKLPTQAQVSAWVKQAQQLQHTVAY